MHFYVLFYVHFFGLTCVRVVNLCFCIFLAKSWWYLCLRKMSKFEFGLVAVCVCLLLLYRQACLLSCVDVENWSTDLWPYRGIKRWKEQVTVSYHFNLYFSKTTLLTFLQINVDSLFYCLIVIGMACQSQTVRSDSQAVSKISDLHCRWRRAN